jgi:hypothetical protein
LSAGIVGLSFDGFERVDDAFEVGGDLPVVGGQAGAAGLLGDGDELEGVVVLAAVQRQELWGGLDLTEPVREFV